MIFVVGIPCVSLLYLSVVMTTRWLLDLVRESGARLSKAPNYKAPLVGNSSSFALMSEFRSYCKIKGAGLNRIVNVSGHFRRAVIAT